MSWISRAAVVAVIAAASVAGCDRRPDVKEVASDALEQADIDAVHLDWDRDSKVMHMTGTVPSTDDRSRAEQVVTTAVGTSGTVVNEVTIERQQERMADDSMAGSVSALTTS